jgi:hypothetical protein
MKNIVRWTVGGSTTDSSIDCLEKSIYFWKKLYKNYFNYFIFCNNEKSIEKICHIKNVTIINQSYFLKDLFFSPNDTFWKFCPPRFCLDCHEIILDNDLIVYEQSPTINFFLKQKNKVVTTSAHVGNNGIFNEHLKKYSNLKINTGLVGFPPNYNFTDDLKKLFSIYPYQLNHHCDDQGAFLFLTKNFLKIIPMEEIYVCNPRNYFSPFGKGTHGTHFAGLNQGFSEYWHKFKELYKLSK